MKASSTRGTWSMSMKVRVIKEEYIACGVCSGIAPEVFEMGDSAAAAKVDQVPEPDRDAVREAAESWPTEAIVIEE